MMSLVMRLEELTGKDLPVAGGKGSNLGEMIQAGLPVPHGFVVTTEAYLLFVKENGLDREIARLSDLAAAQRTADEVRAAFEAGKVPEAVERSVAAAYSELGAPPVAVRSSATAEDLPTASFAGQQDTYLYRQGVDDVLNAVRRCWASLWTQRAVAYRASHGIAPGSVSLAVVVQEMVAATAAGILFTADPVDGRRDHMVINSAWGLGEAVVGGEVDPDQWTVSSDTGAVVREKIATKRVMTVRTGSGTGTVPVPEELRDRPTLDRAAIQALVDLGRRAITHFGGPQDIEWAMEGTRLCLVQSRPITSLFPAILPSGGQDDGLRVYVCHTLIQGITEPFTPMGLSVLEEIQRVNGAINGAQLEPKGKLPIMKEAGCRLFIDVTDALRHRRLGPKLLFILGGVEPKTAAILQRLKDSEPSLVFKKQGLPSLGMSFGQAMGVMRDMLRAMFAPSKAGQDAAVRISSDLEAIERAAGSVDPAEGPAFALRAIAKLRDLLLPLFAPLGVGLMGQMGVQVLASKWTGDPGAFTRVSRSIPHNPTTEMDLQLWRVSQILLGEGRRPSAEHPAVQEFLRDFGHRAVKEMDAGIPRWREDPRYVLGVLETYMGSGPEADAERHFQQGQAEAEQAADALIALVQSKRGRLKGWVMNHLVRWMRALSGLRESPKFYTVRLLAAIRTALHRSGDYLAARHLVDDRSDVFWLSLSEVDALLKRSALPSGQPDVRALIASRKAEYEREMPRRHVPRVVTSTGETLYAPPAEDVDAAGFSVLHGTPASPGVYEGVVRVILDPLSARLEQGEVLVTKGTDPAWTPLFVSAGALVVETGGAMSHGAVVAREYGIPAVVGVVDATTRLTTGQRVRVDGGSGVVSVVGE